MKRTIGLGWVLGTLAAAALSLACTDGGGSSSSSSSSSSGGSTSSSGGSSSSSSSSSSGGSTSSSGGVAVGPVDASGATALSVVNKAGGVTVTAETRANVTVAVTFGGADSPARNGDVTITAQREGTTVAIRVTYPATNPPDITVNLDIRAPASLATQVTQDAGDVLLTGMTGGATVDLEAGDITTSNTSGDLDLDCASGSIHANTLVGTSTVTLQGQSTTLALAIPADTNADVNAATTVGTITFTGLTWNGTVTTTYTGATATGPLGTGAGGTLQLTTTQGSISVSAR